MITKDNIEAYLIDLLEGRLSQEEELELRKCLKDNPEFEESLSMYDPSLVLLPDTSVVFEDKESLKHPSKTKVIFPLVKYFSIGAAACFVLFFLISQLVLEPSNNIEESFFNNVLVKRENIDTIEEPTPIIKDNKTEFRKSKAPHKPAMPLAKENEIEVKEDLEEKKEPKIILSNSLVVYEVNNMVVYKEDKDWEAKEVIEVNNMVVFKDNTPKTKDSFFDILKDKFETKVERGIQEFNSSLAFFQENVSFENGNVVLIKRK